MGPVNVTYDNSQHTTHNVSHHSSSTSQAHHEDKSQHSDHSVNTHNTVHQHGPHAGVFAGIVALVAVLLGGIILLVMALRQPDAKPISDSSTTTVLGGHEPPLPGAPTGTLEPKPAGGKGDAAAGVAAVLVPSADGRAQPISLSSSSSSSAPPIIETAEIGIVSQGRFIPCKEFKTNDLLTLRLRVSRDCRLRVLYQQASGPPLRMFPEADGGSDLILGGTEMYLPDPAKLEAHAPDATAFLLFHDTGKGAPIHEQIVVQIAEEPFTPEGTIRNADTPYRVFKGLTLADARIRGVLKLQGLSVSQAQSKMDALLSERTLPFTISP